MKLLVTGAWRCTQEQLAAVEALGHQITFMQNEQDPLPLPPQEIEGVIGNGLFLHHPIEEFTALRYIQLTSAGFDRVPLEYIDRQGITLHNARGVYSTPMAEFALAGVLQLYKNTRFFNQNQQERRWEKCRDLLELAQKTVCIVGCGSVGQACAKRFAAFDCRVVGVDLAKEPRPHFEAVYGLDRLPALLNESDIVVLTLPLTEQTHHLFDRELLAAIKKGGLLVNIARGGIVDTTALVEALEEGRLSGAVLDVFEKEPLPDNSPLWTLPNVVLTPHNSFVGEHNGQRLFEQILKNLKEREQE